MPNVGFKLDDRVTIEEVDLDERGRARNHPTDSPIGLPHSQRRGLSNLITTIHFLRNASDGSHQLSNAPAVDA